MTSIGFLSSCRSLWHLKDIKRLFLVGPDPVFRDEDVYISVVLRTDLRRTRGLVMMLWCGPRGRFRGPGPGLANHLRSPGYCTPGLGQKTIRETLAI